jgi:hypothetical protein
MSKACPPVKVNMKEVVDAAADKVISQIGEKNLPGVHSATVSGIGKIVGFVPGHLDGTEFILGYVTLPSVINFATKLAQLGIVFPQIDLAVSRGGALGLTLLAHVFTGGKSFLLGSFLGQFPSALDSLADVAVAAIVKSKGGKAVKGINGLGASAEETQLKILRENLEKLSGSPGGMGDGAESEELSDAEMVIR